jgi:hypothetical protein
MVTILLVAYESGQLWDIEQSTVHFGLVVHT